MSNKPGPNEPCSCGSGKKFKKCCGAIGANALAEGASYDRVDRDGARRKVAELVERAVHELGHQLDDDEGGEATENPERRFWGEYADVEIDLYDLDLTLSMEKVRDNWIAFDWRSASGERLADQLLKRKDLRSGEVAFLEGAKRSVLLPYEVVERAGSAVTLRDLTADAAAQPLVVQLAGEELGAQPDSFVLARVVAPGISGKPELEGGVLRVPNEARQEMLDAFAENRRLYLSEHAGSSTSEADKALPPKLAQLWLARFLAERDSRTTYLKGDSEIAKQVSALGLDGVMGFAKAHPQASLNQLAELLDADSTALCWELVDEGVARQQMRSYALELLVRLLWCLPKGWSQASKGKDYDMMMTYLQGWEIELQEAGCDEQAHKIINLLAQDKTIPTGWRPADAADPKLLEAFAVHWPE